MTDATQPPLPDDPGKGGDVDRLAFDEAFAELQRVVGLLEAGEQSLESTITQYERAVALQRRCERLLGEAELRVQQLMKQPGGDVAVVEVQPGDAGDETGDGG